MRPDTFSEGSVTNRNDYEPRPLDGQHVVIHLATESGTEQSMYEIEKYTSVNIDNTSLMLGLLTNTKYGRKGGHRRIDETQMLIAVYGSEVPWR